MQTPRPKRLGMASGLDWFRRWRELRGEHTAYYSFDPIEFHVNGYAHEQFADSRCCWMDVRSRTRRRAKRWDTEGLPAGSHPELCEAFDDVSGPRFGPCHSTEGC